MSKEAAKTCMRVARPVMSANMEQAHTRVIGLYRAFYRYIPYILKYFDIPKNHEDCRKKIRENFYRNKKVSDVRVVDILVIKGYMELKEVTHQWQQKSYVMSNWNPTAEPKPKTFVEKFLAGVD
ncbi:PREDICTED: NADH dehydrogenase [ubiquinone] 1 alpha subcomplex subunit 6-like [Papilio polytes]|uniref:NADH dehydrogenase [ubiquinone] 1 alpha subcomplex subunit 6-like n=1 Tax=Papilio polytes TaxID=76194 RepID=UPI000676597B|nr:PREDICTED: NADH dehydrogenase [ubiquinone] 1 alpha subcomplex subunit 6-like [Papilio polytes]